ncbi:hypothetical protein [Metabacillus sp. Hm71]|uniref:hypothetical protein n=1 Tax=Metabacillus sp. Hm71 TaxID=3450743 RepID=UPI003F420EE9
MSETYTDYLNKTILTLPEKFIDVKTGQSYPVSPKILEQVEYHTNNNTLIHLVLSALYSYLHHKPLNGGNEKILYELLEIKKMMQMGYVPNHKIQFPITNHDKAPLNLELNDIEDVLESFGG